MTPKNSLTPKEFELTIDSLSYSGGRGVGRFNGQVVFVPRTAPGDVVRVRVTADKGRFLEAEVVELRTPSVQRREPPCPVANRCGGCPWQHVTYDEQIRQKEKILSDSLRRLSGFRTLEFLRAAEEFHYRNRVQVQVRGAQRGFFAHGTRDLVAIEKCYIAEPEVNAAIAALGAGADSRVEIALTEDGHTHVTPTGERRPEAAFFAQVNRAQNEVLKKQVVELVEGEPEWIFDLYAGTGNITEPLRRAFSRARLTAVELSRAMVDRARGQSVEWIAGDVGKVLRKRERPRGKGLVVLDPPRPGCDREVTDALARLFPEQIVYVSCNPSTFARDAERLVAKGYRLETVQGLDMFPQTEHVELLASFRR